MPCSRSIVMCPVCFAVRCSRSSDWQVRTVVSWLGCHTHQFHGNLRLESVPHALGNHGELTRTKDRTHFPLVGQEENVVSPSITNTISSPTLWRSHSLLPAQYPTKTPPSR